MRTTSVDVIRIATRSPGDVSGLVGMISSGRIDPKSILAILGKTEGAIKSLQHRALVSLQKQLERRANTA